MWCRMASCRRLAIGAGRVANPPQAASLHHINAVLKDAVYLFLRPLVSAEVCADHNGQVGEWLKPTDCKSVTPCELRRFESFPVHQFFVFLRFLRPL
jgi:hypothetical protein